MCVCVFLPRVIVCDCDCLCVCEIVCVCACVCVRLCEPDSQMGLGIRRGGCGQRGERERGRFFFFRTPAFYLGEEFQAQRIMSKWAWLCLIYCG